jgi:hypothetical protein
MKKILVFVFAFLFVASVALAVQDTDKPGKVASPAQKAQQEKMKSCNAEAKAKGLKGDERKAFMSECLSGKVTGADAKEVKMSQQDKMKSCNQEAAAKSLKGDERKAFMSDCLKR